MATIPASLPGKSHGQRSMVGSNHRGNKETQQQLHTHTHTHTHTHFLKSPSNERISMWQQTIIWLQYIFQECKYFMKYQSFRRTSENFFLTYLLPSTPPNPHTLSLLAFMKIGKPSQTPTYCGNRHIQNFTDIFTRQTWVLFQALSVSNLGTRSK